MTQLEHIANLLIEFDEMGMAPRTTVPDPETYAIEWRQKLTNAISLYASEVAREIIKDLVKFADDKERQMSFHGHSVWYIDADDVTDFIAELKKKYTEERK